MLKSRFWSQQLKQNSPPALQQSRGLTYINSIPQNYLIPISTLFTWFKLGKGPWKKPGFLNSFFSSFMDLSPMCIKYKRQKWFCYCTSIHIQRSLRCYRICWAMKVRFSNWFYSVKNVIKLFLCISMAYNVISCIEVAEITQILRIAYFFSM